MNRKKKKRFEDGRGSLYATKGGAKVALVKHDGTDKMVLKRGAGDVAT